MELFQGGGKYHEKDKVEEAVKWCVENSNLSFLHVPILFDLTSEERDWLLDRLKEKSVKLIKGPKSVLKSSI